MVQFTKLTSLNHQVVFQNQQDGAFIIYDQAGSGNFVNILSIDQKD